MKMEKPTVEAVRFNTADVIATSGGVAPGPVLLSGFENSDPSDNTVKIGTTTYGPSQGSNNDYDALMSELERLSGSDVSGQKDSFFSGTDRTTMYYLWNNFGSRLGDFNGTYTWYNAGEDSYWKHD